MKQFKQILPVLLAIVTVALLVTVYRYSTKKEEGFEDNSPLQNLKIYSCPKGYEEVTVRTGKGTETALDCCEGGNVVNDKCQGITFCTKGTTRENKDPSKTIHGCLDKWRSYYKEKAVKCPGTMPNYYEDLLGTGPKGCTASAVREDGKAPSDGTQPKCVMYEKEEEKYNKKDSCTLEKDRLDFSKQCPPVSGNAPAVLAVFSEQGKFKYFQCKYNDEPGYPNYCNDDANAKAYYDRTMPNWEQSSDADTIKLTFCGNYIEARRQARSIQNEIASLKQKNETMQVQVTTTKTENTDLKSQLDAAKTSNQRLEDRLKSTRTTSMPL